MSFTQAENLFAGVHEQGLNDLLRAFFMARPRHLKYGSPQFVPATTATGTSVPAVVFAGITVQFLIDISIPTVDITPGGPPELPAGVGEFIVKTRASYTVKVGINTPQTGVLQVYGRCAPVVTNSAPGTGDIGISLKKVEIVDITPTWLEDTVELMTEAILKPALAAVKLPFSTLTAGAFGLILLAGPVAETDHIKVRGNAL